MSDSSSPQLHVDFAALPLPTDRLSLGQLRRRQPTIFDRFSEWRIPADLLEILATVHLEHVLARRAFAASCGSPDPHPETDRRELIRLLNDDYRRYGISFGLEHTRQFVRDIETAAEGQAREQLGRQT